jgi:hypothetical protein
VAVLVMAVIINVPDTGPGCIAKYPYYFNNSRYHKVVMPLLMHHCFKNDSTAGAQQE